MLYKSALLIQGGEEQSFGSRAGGVCASGPEKTSVGWCRDRNHQCCRKSWGVLVGSRGAILH